jgi:hypothetical protein
MSPLVGRCLGMRELEMSDEEKRKAFIKLLDSYRGRSPEMDEYLDECLASSDHFAALRQIRQAIVAEHPDMPAHERGALLAKWSIMLRGPSGRA